MQVINQDSSYNQKAFEQKVKELTLEPTNRNYFVISIIGTQSSGKSTLLNYLFHTNFELMTGVPGTRTTCGVWVAVDHQQPFVILDCEGNDSLDRASQNDFNFERSVSMYSLSLSNLLLVNVMTDQVGTYDGCQYGTITMLIQMSLKIFKQDSVKTILFCLRDFDPNVDNLRQIQKHILNDVKEIWAELPKPEKYKNAPHDRFFNVVIHPIFKYKHDNHQKFDEDVAKLREKLVSPSSKEYLFRGVEQKYNLPLMELPEMSRTVWTAILQNKDINVPGFRIQLSNMRCEEIKRELIGGFKEWILKLKQESQEFLNCVKTGQKLHNKFGGSMVEYSERTKCYDKKVSKEKDAQLRKSLIEIIEEFNESLVKTLKEEQLLAFKETNLDNLPRSTTLDQQLRQLRENAEKKLEIQIKELRYGFPSKNHILLSFGKELQSLSKQLQQRVFEDCHHSLQAQFNRTIDEEVVTLTNKLDTDLWLRVKKGFEDCTGEYNKEAEECYRWVYGVELPERYRAKFQEELERSMKDSIRQRLDISILDKLVDRFDSIFLKSKGGIVGKVLTFKRQEFQTLFKQARTTTLSLLKSINTVPSLKQTEIKDIATNQELFSSQKYEHILDQLEKAITSKYQKTQRKETERKMDKVPPLLWLVLLLFSFGEIRTLLSLFRR